MVTYNPFSKKNKGNEAVEVAKVAKQIETEEKVEYTAEDSVIYFEDKLSERELTKLNMTRAADAGIHKLNTLFNELAANKAKRTEHLGKTEIELTALKNDQRKIAQTIASNPDVQNPELEKQLDSLSIKILSMESKAQALKEYEEINSSLEKRALFSKAWDEYANTMSELTTFVAQRDIVLELQEVIKKLTKLEESISKEHYFERLRSEIKYNSILQNMDAFISRENLAELQRDVDGNRIGQMFVMWLKNKYNGSFYEYAIRVNKGEIA